MLLERLVLLTLIVLLPTVSIDGADEFEDYRCRCVCPSFTVVQDPPMNDTHRRVYVAVVPPDNCTCERVVFDDIVASKTFQQLFCPRYDHCVDERCTKKTDGLHFSDVCATMKFVTLRR
jgi:hypothetical protein